MISHKKIRECSAITLVVLAVVGLCWKIGIAIPFVSKGVITFVGAVLSVPAGWAQSSIPFLAYLAAFKGHIIWCVSATWLGIAEWLWSSRDHATEGFLEIFFYYGVFMAALISSSAFAIAYNLDPFFNIRFYSSSFALSLVLSLAAGKIWSIVQSLPGKNR